MNFDYINDCTGFANGDLFSNEEEVREYFTIENLIDMFGDSIDIYEYSQELLDDMVETVIENKWHMEEE